MFHRRLLLLWAFCSAASISRSALVAQCTGYVGYNSGGAATIGVHQGEGWPEAPPIASAISMWDCSGMMGSTFPGFRDNAAGDINVYVHRKPGRIPQNDAGCGRFVPQIHPVTGAVIGGDIELYAQDSGGADCLWIYPHTTLDNVIAHELGHVLTLANSNCSGYLMGPGYPTAGTHPDECDAAAARWFTPYEQAQENCDLQCSEPCTGSPPSCPDPGSPGDDCPPDLCSCNRCSPLIFDLNGDGIHTTSVDDDPVIFDFTGDSVPDRGGWTNPRTEEGILYHDANRNRKIDGAAELFGDRTILRDGSRAAHGFVALAAYDEPKNGGNGDGVVSPADRVWGRIRMWVDRNHDGIVDNGENHAIGELRIVEINLEYEEATEAESHGVDPAGNFHRFKGSFVRRMPGRMGTVRAVHDVYFMVKPLPRFGTAP